jgi:hypothetical protein
MKRIALAALAASLLLVGCGTDSHVADELTTFNEAQQKGTSQLILLNILRARERQPLAYSHFDVLRGGISGSASAGLAVPFGPGAAANALATGIGLTPGISQDVKPQDDQDFYRGILTPVSAETWALYQDQNWASDLLFHLFVEYIKLSRSDYDTIFKSTADLCGEHADIVDVSESCSDLAQKSTQIKSLPNCLPDTYLLNGKTLLQLLNDPGDRCRQLQYDTLTQAMTILGFHIAQVTTKADVGPALPPAAFHDTQWPFALKGSNVEVAGSGSAYQFKTVSKDYTVALSNMPCAGAANIAVAATSEIGAQIRDMKIDDKAFAAAHGCEGQHQLEIGITTRSPDGMLYYMGEVARALLPLHPEQASQSVTLRGDNGKPQALMSLVEGDISSPAVRVTYHGTTYSIPRGDDHVTMQAFELLEQVFALYNRASVTPSTTAVTVVP